MTKKPIQEDRQGHNHKFKIGQESGVITLNTDKDGNIVEVFIAAGEHGSTLHGLLESLSLAINIGLRHGIPIKYYTSKFVGLAFDPKGYTTNKKYKELKMVNSVVDYLAKYILSYQSNGGKPSHEAEPFIMTNDSVQAVNT